MTRETRWEGENLFAKFIPDPYGPEDPPHRLDVAMFKGLDYNIAEPEGIYWGLRRDEFPTLRARVKGEGMRTYSQLRRRFLRPKCELCGAAEFPKIEAQGAEVRVTCDRCKFVSSYRGVGAPASGPEERFLDQIEEQHYDHAKSIYETTYDMVRELEATWSRERSALVKEKGEILARLSVAENTATAREAENHRLKEQLAEAKRIAKDATDALERERLERLATLERLGKAEERLKASARRAKR